MKKIILSTLVLGAMLVTKNTMAQVTIGPKLGLNIAHINISDATTSLDPKSKVGFQIGGMLNAQINDYFSIRPELLFNNIGSKFDNGFGTLTFNTNYLSIPLNFVGQYPIDDNFKLQAFAGPYMAFGLGGKYKSEGPLGNYEGSIKMKKDPLAGGNSYYMNSLDFGLNFGLGFQYSAFVFTANYSLGLTKLEAHYKDSAAEDKRGDNGKMYNRNITLGIAWLFGGE